jgi:hypothetical protein
MPALFAFTLFVSAALLFGVQPMIAKMLLPLLGGASAVWTTCMVFYQAVLLAGYFYAHVVSNRFPIWLQGGLQIVLLGVAFALLPFEFSDEAVDRLTAGTWPTGWLLTQLVIVAGLPFFVVSTTGPLLQRWFSHTGHATSGDPYYLYAASNLGSLLALAAYPLWFEPSYTIDEQTRLWCRGFLGLLALTIVCAGVLARTPTRRASGNGGNANAGPDQSDCQREVVHI